MKKTLLLCVLLATVAFNNQAFAQDVTLKVTLRPIQTILINPAQKIVDLNYATKENYSNGVKLDQVDHISIYSTGGFAVKVKSGSPTLGSAHTGISEKIDATDILITPTLSTTTPLAGSTLSAVSLSTTPKTLITNTTGGIDKSFNINYAAAGGGKYVNKYFNVESPTVYTTTVTYTIEAQ